MGVELGKGSIKVKCELNIPYGIKYWVLDWGTEHMNLNKGI